MTPNTLCFSAILAAALALSACASTPAPQQDARYTTPGTQTATAARCDSQRDEARSAANSAYEREAKLNVMQSEHCSGLPTHWGPDAIDRPAH